MEGPTSGTPWGQAGFPPWQEEWPAVIRGGLGGCQVAEERQDDQVPEPLQDGDVLFRIQMRVADAFFAHWKRGLVSLLAVLLLVLIVGTWKNRLRDAQRDTTASIAAIDRKMPEVDQLAAMGLAPLALRA